VNVALLLTLAPFFYLFSANLYILLSGFLIF
jgi:hypothetical protein